MSDLLKKRSKTENSGADSSNLLKKRNKIESNGDAKFGLKKKVKGDGEEKDVDFDAIDLNEDEESIQDDGEVSSDHSEVELDLNDFAKFCKENPMGDNLGEDSYDSEDDEDYDSDVEEEKALGSDGELDEDLDSSNENLGDELDASSNTDTEEDPITKALKDID